MALIEIKTTTDFTATPDEMADAIAQVRQDFQDRQGELFVHCCVPVSHLAADRLSLRK